MLAVLSTLSIAAHAEEPKISFSGLIDMFYQSNFKKSATGSSVNFRQFDVTNNSFTIASVQGTAVMKPTAENPWGFTLQFSFGKNADILAATEPAGPNSALKYVQQGYVTYQGKNYTLDFGKFPAWVGYEGIVAADCDHYSRPFLYTLAQPIYHLGGRASSTVGPVAVSLYLVNGWNETEDSNAGKTYGASGSVPVGKGTLTLNYIGGNEGSSRVNGFGAGGNTSVHQGDVIFQYPISDKLKFTVNADYASATGLDAGDPGGKFYGAAGYLKYTASSNSSIGLRVESVNDPNGFRTGFAARYQSITAGYDMGLSSNSTLRAELRYDKSNLNVFNRSNGGLSNNRTTLTIAHILRF